MKNTENRKTGQQQFTTMVTDAWTQLIVIMKKSFRRSPSMLKLYSCSCNTVAPTKAKEKDPEITTTNTCDVRRFFMLLL